MYGQPQDIKERSVHNSETRTPRASRSSNQRQEVSPFVHGRKNLEQQININNNNNQRTDIFNQPIPQYHNQDLNNRTPKAMHNNQEVYNQEVNKTPKAIYNQEVGMRTPKAGPKSIISNDSSNTQGIDMVCTNCINKHLMMQKKDRERLEKEKDQILRQIAESNYQNALQKEAEKQKIIKEQYKNEARTHIEQIENKKAREEHLKRSYNNDLNKSAINNADQEKLQRMQERQNELRQNLLKQINEKEMEKKNEKFNKDTYKTTLDIGNDSVRPRTAFPKNYGDELRQQMLYKENQKQWEKDNDKMLAEAQKDNDRRFNNDIQNKKYQLESQKKDDLKRAYQEYIQSKMKKMQDEQNEKEAFNQSQQRLKQEAEKQQYEDYFRRKELEKNVGQTVKSQIEFNNIKKQIERNENNSPVIGNNMCAHRNKMVSCSECNKKYPKQQMCKRADSPLKFSPQRYND